MEYNFKQIESKWQELWSKNKKLQTDYNNTNNKIFKFLDYYKSGNNNSPLVYVCENYSCKLPTNNIEQINKLLESTTRQKKWEPIFRQFPTVPYVERDISLIVLNTCIISDIIVLIQKTGKPLIESAVLIDKISGCDLNNNELSLTFRLRYRSNKTLKDTDVDPIHNEVIGQLSKKLSAKLRN